MGKQLSEMYNEAKTIGGFSAQLKLAMYTMVSSIKAEQVPDSPELIERFKKALDDLRKEYKSAV